MDQKDDTGALFKNQRKTKETHPDYTGSATIDGVEYWVSAWLKKSGPQSKTPGQTYMSLAYTEKDATGKSPAQPGEQTKFEDEDIPF